VSSIWGTKLKISVFGESHGEAIGVCIDGLPHGVLIDHDNISRYMARRAPGNASYSTPRKESDQPEILSGVFNGFTTGAPLCAIIRNQNTRSTDYEKIKDKLRPGHADYTGAVKFNGFNDYRGGGHFSGRLTAPIVFAGAICAQILKETGIFVGTHIFQAAGINDKPLNPVNIDPCDLDLIKIKPFPVIDDTAGSAMLAKIEELRMKQDSAGGIVEGAIVGVPAGIGFPMFDSIESVLSHLFFSIPAVKGVEFGAGFAASSMTGSICNDPFNIEGSDIKTKTNNHGGILGGISTGMPIIYRVAFKPTPSISQTQATVDINEMTNTTIEVQGRHDPCVVPRASVVVEAASAIGILDLMLR